MTSSTAPARRLPIVVEFANRSRLSRDTDTTAVALMVTAEDARDRSPELIAEDVFVATNAPYNVRGTAAEIRAEFTRLAEEHGIYFPSLSVGDLVHVGAVTVRVDPVGFTRVA